MGEYKKYPKIHRLGKEETDGILDNELTIQEKVDGANCSIFWLDGKVRCGTRTRMLPEDESFNGFQEFVKANPKITNLLAARNELILYGEWLVKHTITYPDEAYRKVYLFDIYNTTTDEWLDQPGVKMVAEELGLEYPHIFANGRLTEEQIKEFVGTSAIAPSGEGVVIKAEGFLNKFGDHVYAKLVHEKFKESNAIVFGGNNKHSETYWEMYVVNKYCTTGRVQKIMQKMQPQVDRRMDMEHTSMVAGSCYHDMITEEIWEIVKKVPALNFKKLQGLCMKKFIQIYHDILNNTLSVADTKEIQNVSK
jgi:hypothetical protein